MKYRLLCIFVAVLAAVLLVSCSSSSFTDEEICSAAEALIADSVAINQIYFGEGLPFVDADSDAARQFAAEVKTDATLLSYLPVAADAGFSSIDSIKEATEKVYSKAYCAYLFEMAFTGISIEEGTAAYARYMETENGILAVHRELSAIDIRTYSTAKTGQQVEVIQKKGNTAVVKAQSYLHGEEDVAVEIQLIYENGAWRLDSPTY